MADEKKTHRCAFTGHRPEKLLMSESEICEQLRWEVARAIEDGFTVFITGMARGVDIWAAEIVLQFRREMPALRLVCACPYPRYNAMWVEQWKRRSAIIEENADIVKYVSAEYSRGCFQRRNMWMIDHAARLIAVYNGSSGGTYNTIRYARQRKVDIRFV